MFHGAARTHHRKSADRGGVAADLPQPPGDGGDPAGAAAPAATRAKEFYGRLGWRLDLTPPGVVQFTPHGSGCSVQFGPNLTSAAPGSAKGYLIVSDIEAARDALVAAGIEVSEVFHLGPDGRSVVQIPSMAATARSPRSATRTATAGCCRRSRLGFPGASTRADVVRLPKRPGELASACGGRPRRAREAHRAARRKLVGLVRRVHGGRAGRDGAADVSDYDVIVLGGGAPGEHCAAALAARGLRAGCASPSLSESWSAASAPTGLVFRRSRCCARARRCRARARPARARRSTLRPRWPGGTSWCRAIPTPGRSAGWPIGASTCCAARAGLAGTGVVEVEGVRRTAEHIVVATGADPIVPAIPGLRELDGVWTNREVTGMKAVPRRLLILGGGPVCVEMTQVVRRLGGEGRGWRASPPARCPRSMRRRRRPTRPVAGGRGAGRSRGSPPPTGPYRWYSAS